MDEQEIEQDGKGDDEKARYGYEREQKRQNGKHDGDAKNRQSNDERIRSEEMKWLSQHTWLENQ